MNARALHVKVQTIAMAKIASDISRVTAMSDVFDFCSRTMVTDNSAWI